VHGSDEISHLRHGLIAGLDHDVHTVAEDLQ
jgi:hypothetical protein